MKSLIIVSNKKISEIDKFNIAEAEFLCFLGRLTNGDKEIIVIDNSKGETDLTEPMKTCNAITPTKVLLYHGDFKGYQGSRINIGTGSNQSESATQDRAKYEELLNAEDKFSVFDDVWNYFSKKNNDEKLERDKTDFLYHIYNGGTPSSFAELSQNSDLNKHEKLYQEFNDPNKLYKKELDFDEDETKGKDQRTKLSLLRDALLANN